MSGCLKDQDLLLLTESAGASLQDRAHLESCTSCTRRYQELISDLRAIRSALELGPPPVSAVTGRFAIFRFRMAPLTGACAVAMAVVVIAGVIWLRRPPTSRSLALAPSPDTSPALEQVSSVLASNGDVGAPSIVDPVAGFVYPETAQGGYADTMGEEEPLDLYESQICVQSSGLTFCAPSAD